MSKGLRRGLVFAAVAAFLVAMAPAALAAPERACNGNKPPDGHKVGTAVFTAHGVVKAVDDGAGTLTMRVWSGARVRKERGKDIVVNVVAGKTKIWRVVRGKAALTALGDVQPGERIWVKGTFCVDGDGVRSYTAGRIRLKATWPFMARGSVVSVDSAAGSLVVKVSRSMLAMRAYVGEEVTFFTTETTVVKKLVDGTCQTIALDQVVVGDSVRVHGRVDNRDPGDRRLVATRIFVLE